MTPLRLLARASLAVALLSLAACSGKNKDGDTKGDMYGKYKLHATKYDDASRARAKDNASDVLTQLSGEDKVCLIGLWAYNPPAILNAAKAARREGKVQIVGFDEDELTLKGIREGQIHATVVQDPFGFGYSSVQVMAALSGAPKAKMPDEVKDGIWHVPHRVIKKDNVDAFHDELKKRIEAGRGADPKAPAGAVKVAFVSNNEEEFWNIAAAGTRKAAADFEVEVLFRRPKGGDPATQKQLIQDLLNEDVKAIAERVPLLICQECEIG